MATYARGAEFVAHIANMLLTALRNRRDLALTREEFRYSRITFGQFGEDSAIVALLASYPEVAKIYVDVGCFHPIQHSNTLLLHKAGWRGVNIDMHESKIATFRELRPYDHNIVAACSDVECDMQLLIYGGGVTDRIAAPGATDLRSAVGNTPLSSQIVRTKTLDAILAQHGVTAIGYLNVDCEGHDLAVLRGLDLRSYRPAVISVEADDADLPDMTTYLAQFGFAFSRSYYKTRLFCLN